MPLYAYQVMDRTGSELTGKLEAEHQWSAAARLQKMGYIVLDVAEVKESSFKKAFSWRKKVSIGDLCFFTRQLAAMLRAGIPLTRSLFTLSEQAKNPTLAEAVAEIARGVEGGLSFSEALRPYSNIFSSLYVDMVKAGEMGGALDEILRRLSEQLEREKSLRDSIRSATFYPAVVLVFATGVILALMFFIVPVFSSFFPQGTKLPLVTEIILDLSRSLRSFWYFYLLGLLLAVLGLRVYAASESGRERWEKIKFKLPVLGDLFKKAAIARFSRILATLLSGGIPVLQALETAGPASGSRQVSQLVKDAGAGIQEGQSIVRPLERSGFFPPMLTNMVAVGEETGELSTLLAQVADFYEEEVATMTKGLTALIEPILIIFIGLVIGGIVISIYLPIFNVVTSVGG
ncbi:type IV pilus assembly protein PilC [Desulfohalotomaculum tongense]|uniref:type II secretion system F family protein n=1 Tax=Desulforadius tongensis TaxID=1216062 RepID=UPI001956449D|nr:type II secretion system F family protein [Desulforadius tongensis]MBM7854062.1 type IV pilus assembly protein PilC [Desulforadius tongensis]